MSEIQRRLVTVMIENADPRPRDIDDCLSLLKTKQILTLEKVERFWAEFCQVCKQAMDARPPSPLMSPTFRINSVDLMPHGNGALLAAAHDSRDKVSNKYRK